MLAKIVFYKDQLFKEAYRGAIKERKVIGFPQEKGPVEPYSNIFYWAQLSSDYGYIIPEHPHLGFEILTYVLRGGYETRQEGQDWVRLSEGDVNVIHAGKGIRHSEKLLPRSEVLQIWLDPNFNNFRKNEPGMNNLDSSSFPISRNEGFYSRAVAGQKSPLKLHAQNVSVEIIDMSAGFHSLICPEDCVMSGFILDGYIEIDEKLMGRNDFFMVEARREIKVASMVNSKLFITVSPLEPEYQIYAGGRMR